MDKLTHSPYSAFAIGWTYGPITAEQDRTARRYAQNRQTPHASVETVPGYWLNPPTYLQGKN